MPFYDRKCSACDWIAIDVLESVRAEAPACPSCGAVTERAWFTKASTVIGDECDFVQHNGTKEPIHFRSRSKFNHWMREHNYRVKDRHITTGGTDKSKFTTNWAAGYDPYTANNVKILLERAFKAGVSRDDETPLDIRVSTGELTKAQVQQYGGR